MMKTPAIVTWRGPEFDASRELRYAENHFNRKVHRYPLAVSSEGSNQTINELLEAFPWLADHGVWLVARSPAMLWQPEELTAFAGRLGNNPALWFALAPGPESVQSQQATDFPYSTWRGFRLFAEGAEPQTFSDLNREHSALVAVAHSRIPDDLRDIPLLRLPKKAPHERSMVDSRMYVHPLDDYYRHRREDVMAELPQTVRSLLDIGCGFGAFGKAVKQDLQCRVVGVELNPVAAREAARSLDRVIDGDILELDIGETFDVITLNDVLEHLIEPERLLAGLHRLIEPEGRLIVSVPNVGHWSIVDDLIAGRWDVLPAGILCVDHVQFFTRKAIHTLLQETGWTPVTTAVIPGDLPPAAQSRFTALENCGFDVDMGSLTALGFIITAARTPGISSD